MIELATFLGVSVGHSFTLQYPQFFRQTLLLCSSEGWYPHPFAYSSIYPVDLPLLRAVCQGLLDTARTVKRISS